MAVSSAFNCLVPSPRLRVDRLGLYKSELCTKFTRSESISPRAVTLEMVKAVSCDCCEVTDTFVLDVSLVSRDAIDAPICEAPSFTARFVTAASGLSLLLVVCHVDYVENCESRSFQVRVGEVIC